MDRKISELDQVLNLDEQAEFPLSQDNGGTPTTFKAKLTQLAAKIAEAITFSNLITNDKHIIGAINEAAQGSGASMKFEDLSDVDISNLQDGQFSKYDSTTEKWKNTTIQESDVANLVSDLEDKADKTDLVYEKTASGSIASFTDGGDDIPVSEYECEIVAQQASGTPTPVSPLPITGFSQADILVCGVNLFNKATIVNDKVWTGGGEQSASGFFHSDFIKVKPNTTYYSNSNGAGSYYTIYFFDSSKTLLGRADVGAPSAFTTTPDTVWVIMNNNPNNTPLDELQLTEGNTAQVYSEYKGNTYIVEFGQTIYGGRLIYKNGQWSIEATHGYALLGDLSWVYDGSRFQTLSLVNDIKKPASGRSADGVMCSNYNASISGTNETFFVYQTGDLYFYDSAYSNADDFKTGNATTQLVYELATPIIIPISSSTRIKTISGINNIYSSTGDNSVKYFTENADSLAELIKASESESTGDYHEYSTDEQVIGTWIDGRTVYEKTLNVGTIGSGTTFAHGIANLDWIIDYSMFGLYAGENKLVSPANGSSSSIGFVISNWNSTNITFTNGNLSSNFSNCYCTIRYIKSTSNTRSLNLSKGVEETEEKTEEVKTEEVKEEEKNAEQNER